MNNAMFKVKYIYSRPTPTYLVACGLLVIIVCVVFSLVSKDRHQLKSMKYTSLQLVCKDQMQAIENGIILYATKHGGNYPDSLDQLIADDDLPDPLDIGCPVNRQLVPGPPGHESNQSKLKITEPYVYLGKGLLTNGSIDPKTVIVYEPTRNHGDGANFLFADGRVEFITKAQAEPMIKDLEAGINPPKR